MVGKLKNKSERFLGIVHVCACKCGTRVAGLSRKVIQSLQIVCTRTVVGFSALFGLLDASTAKRSELLFGLVLLNHIG